MKQIRIENSLDVYFLPAWELFESSFPKEERRLIESQMKLFKKSNYHFDILVENEKLIGFLTWWEFDKLRYIEYFATVESIRNKGFGKLILNRFIQRSLKPIILEVELPESTLQKRRINFYERIGFKLNTHFYEIPPMHEGFLPLEFQLMTYPQPISESEVSNFKRQCHPIIFED